jgi:hypothetical protein
LIVDGLGASNVLDGDLCGLALALVKDLAPKLDHAVAGHHIEVSRRPCFVAEPERDLLPNGCVGRS